MSRSTRFPYATPESQGVSSRAILDFVRRVEVELHELHSFVLLRHGRIVAEGWWQPFAPELLHQLYSLSKSFTSTAVGLAVAEGRLALDDLVVSFFPDDLPDPVPPNLAAMRVRHLLTMTAGHDEDTMDLIKAEDGSWPRAFLALPVPFPPGTHFQYDTGATYMLSAIVGRLTGQKLVDYLEPRLFGPLGIERKDWEEDPRGVNVGGYGLSVTTEDIAAFGQLYLQRGEWQGRRLVPAEWVAEATRKQVENRSATSSPDWSQGYGYQFWRCVHGAYRGDGAFGQYCIVMPDRDAVLAITSGLSDMQQPLDLVWEALLLGIARGPLPDDPVAQAELTRKLASLALEPPEGPAESPLAAAANGRTFHVEPNPLGIETLELRFGDDGSLVLTVADPRGVHTLEVGHAAWRRSRTTLFEVPCAIAAAGAWTSEDAYVAIARAIETPFYSRIRAELSGDRLRLEMRRNVSFGPIATLTLDAVA